MASTHWVDFIYRFDKQRIDLAPLVFPVFIYQQASTKATAADSLTPQCSSLRKIFEELENDSDAPETERQVSRKRVCCATIVEEGEEPPKVDFTIVGTLQPCSHFAMVNVVLMCHGSFPFLRGLDVFK